MCVYIFIYIYIYIKLIFSCIKVDGKGRENTEGAQHIFEFGNGVHGPSDFFTASNGFSHRSSEWSFGFDFNMASMTKQDAFTLGSFSKSKDNDIANVVTSSTTNKKVDSVENFWDFKGVFPKIGSQHKLVSQFDMVFNFTDNVWIRGNVHCQTLILAVGRAKDCCYRFRRTII